MFKGLFKVLERLEVESGRKESNEEELLNQLKGLVGPGAAWVVVRAMACGLDLENQGPLPASYMMWR